jgi:hypothetical protein
MSALRLILGGGAVHRCDKWLSRGSFSRNFCLFTRKFSKSADKWGRDRSRAVLVDGQTCATGAKGRVARNCLTDEGRPLGTGLQGQVPIRLRRLWSKAMVVNTEGKSLAKTRSGDRQEEDRKVTTMEVSKVKR